LLAYVFWHRPGERAGRAEYEAALRAFQGALSRGRPPGLLDACAFRCDRVPWLGGGPGYEDWYLLDGSAALDVLNDAAVSGARRAPHDAAARLADVGIAGLYRLRAGSPELREARGATWFAKRPGESYDDLLAHARARWIVPGAALFGRQMTLGPTPELCLLGDPAAPLDPERAPIERIRYEPVNRER
jgi:hypothetical protein